MATYSGWGLDLPFRAAIDLGSYQYRFVVAGSVEGEVTYCGSAAGSIMGVLQNDPRAGEEATVRVHGISKVQLDAASPASANKWLKCGSTGLALGGMDFAASTWAAGIALKSVTSGSSGFTEILIRTQRF